MKFEKLGNIARIQIGKTPPRGIAKYWGKGNSWVSISDLKSSTICSTKEEITDLAVIECGCKKIPKDTLLMSFKLSIGKVAFAGKDLFTNEAICGIILKDKSKVATEYLYYALKNTKLVGSNVAVKGATLNTASLNALQIPLLEGIENQLHIANLLSKAENLIAQRKESIRLLDEFLKSTFLEMFGDPVRNEKKWNKSELKNYAKVRIGPFGSLLHREDYVQNGVPLVNPSHIGEGKIAIDPELTISKSKMKELSAYVMHAGDVVLGRRGEIGRCAVVTKKEDGYLCGTGSIFIRPTEKLNPIFLYNIISSASMRKVLENSAKGITMKNLNSGIIENLKIPVPPFQLQTQFAQIVEKTEALKTQYQQSLQELENLYGSLSQKAFRGELVSKKKEAKVIALTPEPKLVQPELNKQQAFLRKLMLASHIIHELCEEPTFGHTKLMKLLYLSEQAGGMALQTNYKKFAAGPFDGKTLTLIDQEFAKNKWFVIEKKTFSINGQQREATVYRKTDKSLLYKKHFDNYFESETDTINRIIELFRKEKTQTTEIVATLYFAWKELIIANTMISKNSLVKSFYQFHKEKKKFTEDEILFGYEFMLTNELYPN
ncbi:MAG: restriction endonuclease subunit S [Flammeovirgaceae bacterium]|nr:MAG: restriction endonuclease subunit S [Flammeovirgaceae bacterium]